VALTASAVLASALGLIFARFLTLITTINVHILVPVVVAVSLTGVYVLNRDPGDVILCLIMGLIGYLMIRFDYPRLTLVIALVLGETAERAFHQTWMISDGDLTIFFTRLASLVLIAGIVFTLVLPSLRKLFDRRKAATEAAAE
jgi:putative tricarboxylic transport membrane protein